MPTTASCRPNPRGIGLRLPLLQLDGSEQMALDAWLLDQCVQGSLGSPILRFYTWPGAWLSLGHHQKAQPSQWEQQALAGALQRVRRPSGGGAVLHAAGLTYALIWPQAPRARREAYQRTSRWLINGFTRLGVHLQPGQSGASAEVANCFASSTAADLVDDQGHKRIGSAQFWRRGHLLQHGEIMLSPPVSLWRSLFESSPPPQIERLQADAIIGALTASLQSLWPDCSWQDFNLNQEQWQQVHSQSAAYLLSPTGSSSNNPEA